MNESDAVLDIVLEASPDRVHTFEDFAQTVKPFQTEIVVPKRFAKYTRVAFSNRSTDVAARVKLFFQAQTYRCSNLSE